MKRDVHSLQRTMHLQMLMVLRREFGNPVPPPRHKSYRLRLCPHALEAENIRTVQSVLKEYYREYPGVWWTDNDTPVLNQPTLRNVVQQIERETGLSAKKIIRWMQDQYRRQGPGMVIKYQPCGPTVLPPMKRFVPKLAGRKQAAQARNPGRGKRSAAAPRGGQRQLTRRQRQKRRRSSDDEAASSSESEAEGSDTSSESDAEEDPVRLSPERGAIAAPQAAAARRPTRRAAAQRALGDVDTLTGVDCMFD